MDHEANEQGARVGDILGKQTQTNPKMGEHQQIAVLVTDDEGGVCYLQIYR